MRSLGWFAMAACLSIVRVAPAARAGVPVPASDPTVAADTSSAVGAGAPSIAEPTLSRAAPSSRSLAVLRTCVGRRPVRVTIGQDDYRLSQARFEPSGVVFPTGGRQGVSLWADEGEPPLVSPIPWDRMDCIRVEHSHAAFGAVTGALLGAWVVARAANQERNRESGDVMVGELIFLPLGILAGASVGAMLGGSALATWPVVWRHAPDPRRAR